MSKLIVKGGRRLTGAVNIQGAKNAVLPILAASILTKGKSVIHNCPKLNDVGVTIEILRFLGADVKREDDTLIIDASGDLRYDIPEDLMRKLRSSIVFMGAILARSKRAKISSPGGCELGPRPIDLHIAALRELGVSIAETDGFLECDGTNFVAKEVNLSFPSVGATENIMLASCIGDGMTTIKNAAKEPEIVDLANFLNKMGAKIAGAGNDTIYIDGAKELCGIEYSIMSDRIVAVTYLCCGAVTGGEVEIKNVTPKDFEVCLDYLAQTGARIAIGENNVILKAPKRLKAIEFIETKPYPLFPTDAQSLFLSMLCTADGKSMIRENIFESRFGVCSELKKMGADILVSSQTALIKGKRTLKGAKVTAPDLRGGAGLIIAALAANGITEIDKPCYIDRGYENIVGNLSSLGAQIIRLS
ncbi:MAG: UDP-N-acetylglucosamine 1-carboxyvinyltransferase [Clostridia bacterium]|nr:UDP-N-acetylglucosamine 1-carboxyvinyltransferase [Clostridia bacterium]